MIPLDCRVAALLAMTKGRTGMGEVGRVPVFGHISLRCHCEPGRAWQSGLLTLLSLRGRSRRELTWQSSLMRHVGCRGDAVEGPMVPLDCHVGALPLLAMTTGKVVGVMACPSFRPPSSVASSVTPLLQNRCKIIGIHARLPQDTPKRTPIQFPVHRYHTPHRTRFRFLPQNDVRTTLTRKTKPQSLQSLPDLLARADRQFRHEPGLPRNSPRSYQCPF